MAHISNPQTLEIALEHKQAGRLIEAEKICRHILVEQPADVRALNMLGNISLSQGKNDAAIEYFRRSISINPGYFKSHVDLGKVFDEMGRLDDSITAYRQAVMLNPQFALGHYSIGNIMLKKEQFAEAIKSYETAIEILPDYLAAYGKLVVAMIADHRGSDAVTIAEKALALNPELPDSHCGLAVALANNRRHDDAIKSYENAISLRPGVPKPYIDMGHILYLKGQIDAAIAAADRVIAFKPDSAAAHILKGISFAEKSQPDDAIASFRAAIAIKPNLANAHIGLGVALRAVGQIDEAIAECRRAAELDPGNAAFHSTYLFSLHFHPDYDAVAISEECRKWNVQHALQFEQAAPPATKSNNANRPLRIGFVSAEFDWHPVGWNLVPLFLHHDRKRIQIFCYSQGNSTDEVTAELETAAQGWRVIARLTDEELVNKIREDRIDILIDLSLHKSGNRLQAFARRPAPVQLTWLGYPGSTGLTAINFRVSDIYLDPPDTDKTVYSEKTFCLPETFWCYQPKPVAPEVGPLPAEHNGYVTFGCLGNFGKVSRPAMATWGKILNAVAGSKLLLHAPAGSARTLVKAQMAAIGIETDRLEFIDRVPLRDYFETYQRIDIALDTFPFAGMTITCDALWMGVPVISLLGKTVTGRTGHSILSNIGMTELIAKTTEQYFQRAIELANDPNRLSQMRRSLRAHMASSPIMQAERFAHNMQVALLHMWNMS